MWILWVLLGIIVLAAMSGGMALGLHLLVPGWSERRRSLAASGLTAILPMVIVFGGFFMEANVAEEDFLLGVTALVMLFFVMLSVCCLPPAWFVTTRLGSDEPASAAIEHDAADAIGG